MSFVITINGDDRTSHVIFNSFRKRDILNAQIDTAEFAIRRYGSLTYEPEVGQEVIVTRNSVRIFGGVILRINESIEASNIITYRVQCVDYSQYLKRRLVTERYTNTTVGAIIADIITNYTDDGLTVNGVVGDQPIESFSFNRLTVADCLQKLADAVTHVWYVDYYKDIHFFPKNAETAPFNLSDTSENYIYNSLEITADLSQIKNSILIQGGEQVSALPRMEVFSGDGTRVQFSLANKYDSLPTVTVDSVAQTVGIEFLNDDASFDVMWNFNEKYIRFTTGNTPASGTNNIEVEGTYLFPIVVKVPAPASIAEYGLYEFAITDKSVRSQDEAIERALAELRVYRMELFEGRFKTYTDGLRSGQVITIDSAQRGKTIDVLIQSVDAKMRDPEGLQLEYTVQFATLKSIGIVEYLQAQLRSKEVIVDDAETLLSFIPLNDTVTTSDSLAAPTFTTGPYVWSNDAETTPNRIVWDYFTWEA